MTAFTILPPETALKVISGKRTLTLKTQDLEPYMGYRAKRGLALPRGFQRVEGLEWESDSSTSKVISTEK